MTDSADVFLSYKAEDRPRLKPLVAALEAEGFSVWWDANIGGGTDWREDIQEHLDAAKCVIVAWSKRTLGPQGRFVRDEAARAVKCGSYLPVRLDAVDPPLGFGEMQALSLERWKGNRADPRFQVLADTIRHRLAGKEIRRKALVVSNTPVSRRGVMIGGGAATAAVAAGVLGWQFLMPPAANANRIAVLPFANLSSDKEQAYFSEGVAEELRGALSRIGLEVIGRASSNEVKDLNTKVAAAKLGVANILTGTVRRSPELIRVNAQLVSASDGVERWAQSYDRAPGDSIRIQTDIATNVAQALSIALGAASRAAITLGGTRDAAAQDLALRARELFNASPGEDELRRAMVLVDTAIQRDPSYADAYRLKARLLTRLASSHSETPQEVATRLSGAELAARRAIQLAPGLGTAYAAWAQVENFRLNFGSALHLTEQALRLSPNDTSVTSPSSIIIQSVGNHRRALALADRAISLEPLRAVSFGRRAVVLLYMRRYPEAIAAARKALEVAPDFSAANMLIGNSLILLNRPDEAKVALSNLPPDEFNRLTGEAIIAARAGDASSVEEQIGGMRKLFGKTVAYQFGQIYAQAGDKDRAFDQLEEAVRAKDPGLVVLKTDPFLDPLRADPRYAEMVKRLKFP